MTASRITTYPPTVAPLGVRLGYLTLRFPGCSEPAGAGPYVWCLPAVGGRIPVEELLFYAMGPVAMVLVYACADERWLSRYNPRQWWGYEPSGMIGLTIAAWSRGDAIFPVEAAVVWLFAHPLEHPDLRVRQGADASPARDQSRAIRHLSEGARPLKHPRTAAA